MHVAYMHIYIHTHMYIHTHTHTVVEGTLKSPRNIYYKCIVRVTVCRQNETIKEQTLLSVELISKADYRRQADIF